jgi:hypothetical protein
MASSPRDAIRRAVARKRTAARQAAALAAPAMVGIILVAWTSFKVFGGLLSAIAIVAVIIQLVVIAWARQEIRLATDQLIDTGTPAGDDGEVAARLDARIRELGGVRERRRTARILSDAIVDARRPRSSNPLVLAGRPVTLTRGAARALIAEQPLASRIATTLADSEADPRAIVAVRNVLFPRPAAAVSEDAQERRARAELVRAGHLLGIEGDHAPPNPASGAPGDPISGS